jgi:hypothetical protein
MLIVPRGETKEFYEFMSVTTHANGDELVIERRQRGRRLELYGAAPEKRYTDRRGSVPAVLMQDDLTVIDPD